MNDNAFQDRRYRDAYFEEKFGNLEKTLDRVDANQTRLFGKYDTLSIDVATLNESKRERDKRSGLWGSLSGGITAVILWGASKFTGG